MICLPDVNVWIALAADAHLHHPVAKEWFLTCDFEVAAFCRVTQMSFLRLVTNRNVMSDEALTVDQAWTAYRRLRGGRKIVYRSEPPTMQEDWSAFVRKHPAGRNVWTDAYLSAFATLGGMTVVTFDRAFPVTAGPAPIFLP
jgi:uncharacterized protein